MHCHHNPDIAPCFHILSKKEIVQMHRIVDIQTRTGAYGPLLLKVKVPGTQGQTFLISS